MVLLVLRRALARQGLDGLYELLITVRIPHTNKTLPQMSEKDKALALAIEIRKDENKYREKRIFCQEHNFNLEAEKFRFVEDILMRTIWKIEEAYDLDNVSYDV